MTNKTLVNLIAGAALTFGVVSNVNADNDLKRAYMTKPQQFENCFKIDREKYSSGDAPYKCIAFDVTYDVGKSILNEHSDKKWHIFYKLVEKRTNKKKEKMDFMLNLPQSKQDKAIEKYLNLEGQIVNLIDLFNGRKIKKREFFKKYKKTRFQVNNNYQDFIKNVNISDKRAFNLLEKMSNYRNCKGLSYNRNNRFVKDSGNFCENLFLKAEKYENK